MPIDFCGLLARQGVSTKLKGRVLSGGGAKGLLIMGSKIDNTRMYRDHGTKRFQIWNKKGKKSLTRKTGYYIFARADRPVGQISVRTNSLKKNRHSPSM